jgi:hypothetical protein
MYAGVEGYFGTASGIPYSRLHKLRGRDITNFQDKIERLRREGIRLSRKLEWDAFVTAYTLHDEVPLHSYPRRIMPLMRQLREQEERARANISEFDPSKFDKGDAAEELQFRFTTNASLIGDLYLVYIQEALTAHKKEALTAEEKCNLYCAAAALQTLVDIWDEAASLMKKLDVGAEGQLGFEFLGIEELVTVVDVAEKAFNFYEEVELVVKNEMSSTADEKVRSHLQKDHEIAATNMAAIASYGFDWRTAPTEFLEIVGPRTEAQTLRDRANALATRSVSLKLSMGLFERHPDHVVLGRNLVYMAIQRRDREVALAAAKKLVDLLAHRLEQTLEVQLAGRKPLGEEPHLEFDDDVRSWFASGRIS